MHCERFDDVVANARAERSSILKQLEYFGDKCELQANNAFLLFFKINYILSYFFFSLFFPFPFLIPLGETLSDAAAWTTKQFNAEAEALKAVIQGQFLIFFLKKNSGFHNYVLLARPYYMQMHDHKYA